MIAWRATSSGQQTRSVRARRLLTEPRNVALPCDRFGPKVSYTYDRPKPLPVWGPARGTAPSRRTANGSVDIWAPIAYLTTDRSPSVSRRCCKKTIKNNNNNNNRYSLPRDGCGSGGHTSPLPRANLTSAQKKFFIVFTSQSIVVWLRGKFGLPVTFLSRRQKYRFALPPHPLKKKNVVNCRNIWAVWNII